MPACAVIEKLAIYACALQWQPGQLPNYPTSGGLAPCDAGSCCRSGGCIIQVANLENHLHVHLHRAQHVKQLPTAGIVR